jgi:hypothetical protein
MADGKSWGKLGGGSGKMHKFDPVAAQTPGQSSQEGSGGNTNIKVKPGPSSVMGYSASGNKSHAGTQTPGQSAAQPTGDGSKFAKGGSTSMFGNRGSIPAKGGSSAP